MNLQEYQTFLQQNAEIESLAEQYALLYRRLTNGFNAQHFGKVEMGEDCVSINWHWHGSYGAEDEGWLIVPATVLFGSQEDWRRHITGSALKAREAALREEEELRERNRQAAITQAKALLEHEGLLPKDPNKDPDHFLNKG